MELKHQDRVKIIQSIELNIEEKKFEISEINPNESNPFNRINGTDTLENRQAFYKVRVERIQKEIHELEKLRDLFNDGDNIVCVLSSKIRLALTDR